MTRRKWIVTAMTLVFLLGSLGVGVTAAGGRPQEKCPVMGGPINKNIYTDYKGKRIYFCCPACPGEFKKDPEKYMKKLEAEGVELEKAPPGN
ncbi:MAG: YHS domain-containing protein [Desulfosoma sp.]